MDAFRLAVTVVVMIGVVLAILLFEKRRAERIKRDTQQLARDRPPHDVPGHDDADDRAP
ncbi:hypothetical protein GCM10023339_71260 [Alloalcanivorax gelatiniphagus]